MPDEIRSWLIQAPNVRGFVIARGSEQAAKERAAELGWPGVTITDCGPVCPDCRDTGHVCEDHPDRAWGDGDDCCGAAGMPCRRCCASIPEDGSRSITDAYVPDKFREVSGA